ncbi:hypothetical protein OG800_16440 [Streptomyces sp. NBC_00445]|uniref:hypothetical protein n=1 Tax=Streptomyces sp. NBC_00445 TaxID=2975745 RepID=UPI002E1BCEE4
MAMPGGGAHTTGAAKLRAGLPSGRPVAGKTAGGKYGTDHDMGVTWLPQTLSPVGMAVRTTKAPGALPRRRLS